MCLCKPCKICKEDKEETAFPLYTNRKGERVSRTNVCTDCKVAYNKRRRHADPLTYNQVQKEKRHARKQRAVVYKGSVCEDCKQTYHWSAFDFHHLDPTQKEKDPGLMMSTSDAVLFKELDKCILLCANCHRVRHFNEGY